MQSLEEQRSERAVDWVLILYAAASRRGGGVSAFDVARGRLISGFGTALKQSPGSTTHCHIPLLRTDIQEWSNRKRLEHESAPRPERERDAIIRRK